MFDKFREECGIFGIYGHEEAANLTYLGLYAMQHRGQESAGIVSTDGRKLYIYKGMGLVPDIFGEDDIRRLPGGSAIGHVRYSTAGGSHLKNVQPILADYAMGPLAVGHNGNIVNASILRAELEARGSIFQSTSDTEVISHLIATSREGHFYGRLVDALRQIKGAYSFVFLTEGSLVAVRDPHGFRPLSLGKHKDAYVVASETCALDLIDAEYIRDIEPGEILVIDRNGLASHKPFAEIKPTPCIFELVYFSRPDSSVFGRNVYEVRKGFGRQLARVHPVDADIVIPVPDSGMPAAIGYAEETRFPFETGLIRNHYIGRTFIEPEQSIRHFGVKIKLNAVRDALRGKRVVVVDDSIVRGTTARKIIKMIRAAGAKEVHFRISSPPTLFPCFYGIDTPIRKELIASTHTVDEINKYITSDTLGYLSIEGMLSKVNGDSFCDACFSGCYPVEFPRMDKEQVELFEKTF